MSESHSMNVRTESAPQPATEVVLARLAELEALGFVRPRSLSPDAYLAALADLHEEWADDLRTLASAYARLRFGGETGANDQASLRSASDRVARSVEPLIESGQISELRDAWRLRTSMPLEPAKVSSPEATPAEPAAAGALAASPISPAEAGQRSPSHQATIAPFLSIGLAGLGRQFPRSPVAGRHAVSAFLVGAAIVAVGASYFSAELRSLVRSWNGDFAETPPMPMAVVTLESPSPFPELAAEQGFMPAWPHLFPSTHPHADLLNEPLAESLSEIAAIYRDLGSMERADAVYAYLARSRPDDYRAQVEYAAYLLHYGNPAAHDAERACDYAERAYSLNSQDERTVATFADALFATGDVARAVEIQQEWLDRERQSGFALNGEERLGQTEG